MKKICKSIIVAILQWEARRVLRKYRPRIIAITGNVGKTSSKDAIFTMLHTARYSVRKSEKSYNSEIGIPLTILGRSNAGFSVWGWLVNIAAGLRLLLTSSAYPSVLVLEAGVDHPGDMKKIVQLIQPDIAVMTAIGEIPVHTEFFAGPQALAREKSHLVRVLKGKQRAVLHYDDTTVLDMKEKTRAQIITYGFGEGADIRAEHYRIMTRTENGKTVPEGIAFKIDYDGKSLPVRIRGAFGKQQVYAVLTAIAVGIVEKIPLSDILIGLTDYTPPPGRLRLLQGIRKTWILDDTYNASPHAMHAALEVLRDMPSGDGDGVSGRKIAVLGDMLELGKFTEEAHRAVAQRLSAVDILVTVGLRAKFIADEAAKSGLPSKNIFSFNTANEAADTVFSLIEQGDTVLVKGSQAMRMERIVERLLAHPEHASQLLVRQDAFWKSS